MKLEPKGVGEQAFDKEISMGVNQGLNQPFQQKPGVKGLCQ